MILCPQLDRSGKRGGQCKLRVEDQLLLVLEYWREYRTQFHIAELHHNRTLAQARVVVEHINRKLKIFRILAEHYRNSKRLRFNLIAAIINIKLSVSA